MEPQQSLSINLKRPHHLHGQERTADDAQPENDRAQPGGQPRSAANPELSDEEQRELIDLVRKYKQSWFLRRRMIVKRALKAYEFFKGNHFISFDPDSFQWFDALEATFSGGDSGNEDLTLYQFATNFYQMLGFAFVAGLSAQVPKTRFLPENAEREEDIATAKAASRVQEIIERQNHIKSLHKQGLLFLWMAGSYFRHTRYIVDSDRAGTHKEPVVELKQVTALPQRFACRTCGTQSSIDGISKLDSMIPKLQKQNGVGVDGVQMTRRPDDRGPQPAPVLRGMGWGDPMTPGSPTRGGFTRGGVEVTRSCICPMCRNPLSDSDFFPEEQVQVPVITEQQEMPNGMVAMTLYSALMVDAAPYAKNLRETPILNVEEEVDIASLRASYPKHWEALRTTLGPMLAEAQNERTARQMVYSESGGRSNFIQDLMPTLSRTWIQSWAFNYVENQETARKLKKIFPKGCLLVNVGDLFLEAREAKLTDEWTWAGTIQETFGLYPPAVGDAAIPLQERINDVANITHEYMDRIAAGMVLYNSNLIDGEALNSQPMLPGRLNPVKMKQAASAMGNRLEDAIVQVKAEIDANIYTYTDKLVFTAQLISGTPPQIFGGAGDPHIETMGGQQQQLSTAMGKLSLFWDNVRDEHAHAAEVAVACAQENMTEDWINVSTDESGQYRNNYVRLDEMEGNIHAYPETDQSFPMTWQEIKAFWEKLIEFGASGKNPYINAIMDDPTNQEQIATWTGVPGLVVPGRDMRNKVLRTVDLLMQQKPVPVSSAPEGGHTPNAVVELPSIEPDKELDDMDIIAKTVREWAQKNFDKKDENPEGFRNVILYYKMAVQYAYESSARAQQPRAPQPSTLNQAQGGAKPD
ncbi:MAG TPA: hypothetical protein VI685_16105 [Candidatus Angelobacter sp.]